jgi:hypothetical protein
VPIVSIVLPVRGAPGIQNACDVATMANAMYLQGAGPNFPRLYAGRIRYEREPRGIGGRLGVDVSGEERFDSVPIVAARGWGDCDDLAPWRAAELRVSGEDPHARCAVVHVGRNKWHIVVRRGDGSYEDPSAALGMRVP